MGISGGPLPLTELCRAVIRQAVTKQAIEAGKMAQLNLPKPIIDFLEYRDRKY